MESADECGEQTLVEQFALCRCERNLRCGGRSHGQHLRARRFSAAKCRVGPTGRVIGVDMTPEMISRARDNARKVAATNVEFRLGEIEHLPVADQTVDAILSNCVIPSLTPTTSRGPLPAAPFRLLLEHRVAMHNTLPRLNALSVECLIRRRGRRRCARMDRLAMGDRSRASRGVLAACTVAVGCGRVGFDPHADADAPIDPDGGAMLASCETSQGLAGYWPFDEGAGTTAADYSGNDQHGELGVDASWIGGRLGGAITFDGADDTVELVHTGALDFGGGFGSFSFSYWLRPSDLAVVADIRPFELALCTGNAYVVAYVRADGRVGFGGYDSVGGSAHYAATVAPAGTLAVGTWTHVAHVLDRTTNEGRTYINGIEVDVSSLATWTDAIDCRDAQIARNIGGWGPFDYAGAIDDVRIYERALTAVEVDDLAKLTESGCPW
jgi:hypothetical protein